MGNSILVGPFASIRHDWFCAGIIGLSLLLVTIFGLIKIVKLLRREQENFNPADHLNPDEEEENSMDDEEDNLDLYSLDDVTGSTPEPETQQETTKYRRTSSAIARAYVRPPSAGSILKEKRKISAAVSRRKLKMDMNETSANRNRPFSGNRVYPLHDENEAHTTVSVENFPAHEGSSTPNIWAPSGYDTDSAFKFTSDNEHQFLDVNSGSVIDPTGVRTSRSQHSSSVGAPDPQNVDSTLRAIYDSENDDGSRYSFEDPAALIEER